MIWDASVPVTVLGSISKNTRGAWTSNPATCMISGIRQLKQTGSEDLFKSLEIV